VDIVLEYRLSCQACYAAFSSAIFAAIPLVLSHRHISVAWSHLHYSELFQGVDSHSAQAASLLSVSVAGLSRAVTAVWSALPFPALAVTGGNMHVQPNSTSNILAA